MLTTRKRVHKEIREVLRANLRKADDLLQQISRLAEHAEQLQECDVYASEIEDMQDTMRNDLYNVLSYNKSLAKQIKHVSNLQDQKFWALLISSNINAVKLHDHVHRVYSKDSFLDLLFESHDFEPDEQKFDAYYFIFNTPSECRDRLLPSHSTALKADILQTHGFDNASQYDEAYTQVTIKASAIQQKLHMLQSIDATLCNASDYGAVLDELHNKHTTLCNIEERIVQAQALINGEEKESVPELEQVNVWGML